MTPKLTKEEERRLLSAFRMPSVQTMVSRKSSITNAFVNAIIPVIEPTAREVAEALEILHMRADDVRCSYCGDVASEWDHLRPLVVGRRPTGYISEIGNLVPSCGKCNQSKGNKHWEAWMLGGARWAPSTRGVKDLAARVERLRAYERWRPVEPIDFAKMVGEEMYLEHWARLDRAIAYMKECQAFAETLRARIAEAHNPREREHR
jgi:hypothetical protein